jgi:hypothetical protein
MYASAADAYDEITRKSRPRYIQDWEDAVRRERAAAVDAGIAGIAPDHLRSADQSADETRRLLAAADYIPDSEAAAVPVDMYRALKPRADAAKARQEIIINSLGAYDAANLNAGDERISAAIAEYEAWNPKVSRDRANEALARYNEALMSAWTALAREKQLEASREREAALAVKANIAVRDEFNGADRIYQQAARDFSARTFKEAAELYGQSAALFIAAARSAEDKRRRAEEAIGAAKQKTAESTALATSMGLIIEEGQDE